MGSDSDLVVDLIGRLRIERFPDVALDDVLDALRLEGPILKASAKSLTRRAGGWVVKESRKSLREMVKHAMQPNRYRQGWRAAILLMRAGVRVPTPRAYAETRFGPFMLANAVIMDFLEGAANVEDFARNLVQRQAQDAEIAAFLGALAGAVNSLTEAGAYHTDLSGKNIFTRDGATFYFIDLDGVILGQPYDDAIRFKNHVQLYDSFCDLWDGNLLDPFLTAMRPDSRYTAAWCDRVRAEQARRRARIEAIWVKEKRLRG